MDYVDGAPGIVFAVDAVFEEHAGRQVDVVKTALQDACAGLFPPIDEDTLAAFAGMISAGERVEITWRSPRPAGEDEVDW